MSMQCKSMKCSKTTNKCVKIDYIQTTTAQKSTKPVIPPCLKYQYRGMKDGICRIFL